MGYSQSERDSHGEVGEEEDIAGYLWKHKEGKKNIGAVGKICMEYNSICIRKAKGALEVRREKTHHKET